MTSPRRSRGLHRYVVLWSVAALALLLSGCDWYQFGGGPQHAGTSIETGITVANVSQLHQRWQITLPSRPDGAPAIVSGVQTPQGKKTLVFVTTTNGELIAYDSGVGGAPVWYANHFSSTCKINNGTSACFTTSSPAVDPALTYVYSYGLDGYVHKHAIGDGTEVTTGGWPVRTTLKPYDEKGSSALTVATAADGHSYLYATHASYPGDEGDYQGHVATIDLATATVHYFNVLCSNQTVLFGPPPGTSAQPDCSETQGGVWARSGVTYDADTNKVYLTSGNAAYDPANHHWGDTVAAINPAGTGNAAGDPADAYTPSNHQFLDEQDKDLGSSGIAVLPTPSNSNVRHLGLQGDKDTKLRLLDLDDLSGQGGPGHLGGEIGGETFPIPQGDILFSSPAVWSNPADQKTWVFLTTRQGVSAMRLDVDGSGTPSLTTQWIVPSPGSKGSPLIANGVLFVASNGAMIAYDAVTGTPKWLAPIPGKIHWQSPVLANGILFVEDESGHLTAWSR